MTSDEYVSSVVAKYRNDNLHRFSTLLTGSIPLMIKDELEPYIRSWAGHYLNEIVLSGSCAKGTAIKGSTDIDLFISLSSNTDASLSRIYETLYNHANKLGLQPRKQNVSIGISYKGYKVDLVPGKVQSGYYNYHSLYKYKTDSWTQTNIKEHIKLVSESGRTTEIMALKIWRDCNGLQFPSIYLELTVLDALKNKSKSTPGANVWSIFHYLAREFVSKRVIDPANTNNVISDDLTETEKEFIAKTAHKSLGKKYWVDILW